MKKILVTGANGFVGKNLTVNLKQREDIELYEYGRNMNEKELEFFLQDCEFVYHLAGVNRPETEEEFAEGNCEFTDQLLRLLRKHENNCPVMFASSVQAERANPYGESKKAAEELLKNHADKMHSSIYIYRFPNLFGKWSRPNYNSVVATFCNNIARNLAIEVKDKTAAIRLQYIDDVVDGLIRLLEEKGADSVYQEIPVYYDTTVGEVADMIVRFGEMRKTGKLPHVELDGLEKKLYSTYLSYLPETEFAYSLNMHMDFRGSFTELFRTRERGQVSVNISKPGVEKGNHWHNSKCEKFCVVSGKACIQLRNVVNGKILSYYVCGEKLEIVDIPCGYTHNIINVGNDNLVTIMWCNECYDPDTPDTFFEKVKQEQGA